MFNMRINWLIIEILVLLSVVRHATYPKFQIEKTSKGFFNFFQLIITTDKLK